MQSLLAVSCAVLPVGPCCDSDAVVPCCGPQQRQQQDLCWVLSSRPSSTSTQQQTDLMQRYRRSLLSCLALIRLCRVGISTSGFSTMVLEQITFSLRTTQPC